MAVVDDKTPRLGLLLPFTDNFLQDDVERLRDTFGLLDVLVVTRDKTTGKIADDMLSSVIAKLDAQGKLLTAQIPSSVVQKGPDGKIDASLMPSIAVVDTFPVPNEASMLGLQCERGDIAIREDLGKTFILTQMPPSVLSNWRELTSTNVTSVNGQTGAITGLAKSGVNNDITGLNALSGPLRLGGDACNPYDAVTLRQLQAAAGGSGGASMNGVMNNFIGCVEWFNGSRAKLPAGYVPADGQVLSQVTYPDIWAAVSSQMLNAVTEALWNTTTSNARGSFYYNRGSYSTGGAAGTSPGSVTPDAWFRVPDLNGGQTGTGSIANTFLNGSAPSLSANVGQLRESAAPNIAGTIAYIGYQTNASDVNGPFTSTNNGSGAGVTTSGTGNNAVRLTSTSFNASNADKVYSGSAGELRPNTAVGIWIIRVAGTFTAQNTNFHVITSDAAEPPANVLAQGGVIRSQYQAAGVTRLSAEIYTEFKWGDVATNATMNFGVVNYNANGTVAANTTMKLNAAGNLTGLGLLAFNSVQSHGGSPTGQITLKSGNASYYAGSLGAAYMLLYPDGNSAPGMYIRSLTASGYTHSLFASTDLSTKVLSSTTPLFISGNVSDSYGSMYKNAAFRTNNGGAASGSSQYQPAVAIMGGTQGLGYVNAVGFGKFTNGAASFGVPAIVGGMTDIDASGGSANNSAFLFGTNNGANPAVPFGSINTPNSGVIAPNGSDRRIKSKVEPLSNESALDRVNRVNLFSFMMNGIPTHGIIAQDAEEIDPAYVVKSYGLIDGAEVNDFRSIVLLPLLTDAIGAINALTARVKELEGKK